MTLIIVSELHKVKYPKRFARMPATETRAKTPANKRAGADPHPYLKESLAKKGMSPDKHGRGRPCYKIWSISEKVMANQAEVVSAAQSGDIEKLRGLLQGNPSLASARDASGVSALMHAYYCQQQGAADLLLRTNASLDIFEATAAGKADKVSAILETDPDAVKSCSADGFTAIHFAAFFNCHEIARNF